MERRNIYNYMLLSLHNIYLWRTQEIFIARSGIVSNKIAWAMRELLHYAEWMIKVKAEVGCLVGSNGELEETNLENLQYLQAMVNETLRLHPPGAFLLPWKSIHYTNVMCYHVAKNIEVLVNVWAIGRESECWDDPSSFKQERFLGSNIET